MAISRPAGFDWARYLEHILGVKAEIRLSSSIPCQTPTSSLILMESPKNRWTEWIASKAIGIRNHPESWFFFWINVKHWLKKRDFSTYIQCTPYNGYNLQFFSSKIHGCRRQDATNCHSFCSLKIRHRPKDLNFIVTISYEHIIRNNEILSSRKTIGVSTWWLRHVHRLKRSSFCACSSA